MTSKLRTLHGNGSEGKFIFVCSSSPQSKCALISLRQHSQVLRQILSSDLFETKFGYMAKKKKKIQKEMETKPGTCFFIRSTGCQKKKNPISEEFLLCLCSNYELADCEFNLVIS